MKKFLIAILAASFFAMPAITFAEEDEINVPTVVYTWIQSTPRGNYYFNHQQICYAVNEDGTINLNILIVPTICTYDNIQIEDVQQKRRMRGQSMKGYNDLVGRADYLRFDLENNTVQITERVDLDSTFSALSSDKSGEPVELSTLPKNGIACRFYRGIIKWAKKHNDLILKHTRGILSDNDEKLDEEDFPIMKINFSGEENEPSKTEQQ